MSTYTVYASVMVNASIRFDIEAATIEAAKAEAMRRIRHKDDVEIEVDDPFAYAVSDVSDVTIESYQTEETVEFDLQDE